MIIFNEIPGPFPWYDKIEKTNRYRKNCQGQQDYKLVAPKNALIPFQYRRLIDASEVARWVIQRKDTGENIEITENIAQVKRVTLDIYDYFYYGGGALLQGGQPLNLAPGFYNSGLIFSDGSKCYSEQFWVPPNSFNVGDTDIGFLKLEWYHIAGDISPFYYSDKVDGLPVFRCVVYLDTFVTESEPVVTQTAVKDGDDNDVPTFIKVEIPYKINLFVPDFLKKALVLVQLHDTINFSSADGVSSGQINSIAAQIQSEAPGCMSVVDLLFLQLLSVVNRTCSSNLIKTVSPITFNYFIIKNTDLNYSYDDEGRVVVTSSLLVGKTGYGVFATQIPNFFTPDMITYNAGAGSFTITATAFDLVDGQELFVFYNLIDVTLFPL